LKIVLSDGVLSDIGTTVLNLLGVTIPIEMDAKILIKKKRS